MPYLKSANHGKSPPFHLFGIIQWHICITILFAWYPLIKKARRLKNVRDWEDSHNAL